MRRQTALRRMFAPADRPAKTAEGPRGRGRAFRKGWTLVPLGVALAILPGAAVAQTYRWVDEQGEVHITDDPNKIPKQQRARGDQSAPPATGSAASAPAGGAASGRPAAPAGSGVALWLRTGGLRGEDQPVLIQIYDSEQAYLAERDQRTTVHVNQKMQRTNQPSLTISNLSRTITGAKYFSYQCVPTGVRPP